MASNWDIFVGETTVARGKNWRLVRRVEDHRGSAASTFSISWSVEQGETEVNFSVDTFPASSADQLVFLTAKCQQFLEDATKKVRAGIELTDNHGAAFRWMKDGPRNKTVFALNTHTEAMPGGAGLNVVLHDAAICKHLARELEYVCRWGLPPGGPKPTQLPTAVWTELQNNACVVVDDTLPRFSADQVYLVVHVDEKETREFDRVLCVEGDDAVQWLRLVR